MILHIAARADWDAAMVRGTYTVPSLESEGFIHCSYPHQVVASAHKHMTGVPGLVLLEIDPAGLPIRVEQGFPHLYADLPVTSVRAVHDFPARPDGTYSLPDSVPAE